MGETVRRTLEYFGLADVEEDEPDQTRALLESLERRVADNTAEIAALREEIERLRARS